MEPENENKPPPVETPSASPDQRRPRGRRRYGRRRFYDRGNRTDNFSSTPGQENSGANHGEGGNASGGDVETVEGTGPSETENGEQVQTEPEFGEGIIEISGKGFGFLRDPKRNFVQTPQDIFVTPELVRRFALRDGMWIYGETRRGNRGPQLVKLLTINAVEPGKY